MVTLLTANKDKKDETSKLQERVKQIQRDFEKKANAFDRLSAEMREKDEEISNLLQEKERVLQISERLKEKEKNDKLLQEHICKLRNELQEKQEKVEDLSQKLDEGTKDIKRLNNSLQTNEQERVKREKMLNNDIDTMNNELEILREKIKEKDSNISQLVKVTDQRLAYCYPDKPAKIGERWASLYTDEWTDFFEDLSEQNKRQGNTNELPEKQLIKIVDWCYKKCLEISKEQNYEIQETLWEVVRLIHNLRVKPEKLKNKCSDDYGSLNKTTSGTEKEFVRKCSELCWYMVCSDPPMVIEYENIENKTMDSNKFNKYNRTGTIVEYVVWPVLLLHIDGPVLAKGSVQTNIEPKNDRIVARKKSVESVIAPPLSCKSISSDDHVTFPSQTTNNNTKSDNIQVQTIPSKKTVTNQLEISDVVLDLQDSPQKDQSIRQNKGKPDDDSNMREAGTLKQRNGSDDIRVVIEHSKENFSNVKSTRDKLIKQNILGPNVDNGVVLKTAKFDQSCSGDLNTQYESDKTCTTGETRRTNVSSETSRNKNISASTEKISTDNSISDFGEITKSKCAEFMKSEENVVKLIDDDKYNANFLLQSRRRHLLKSQSMIEEHVKETIERDVPNCDDKTNRFSVINRTVSTSFLGESISRNNAKMFNTKYYGKPENLVEGMPSHTDTLKRSFDKATERSKIPPQLTKGKEQTKT
ncbi:Hypothetical predicted protein [Mytilus galloprovincialis]|uniref:Mitochondria-eating protein C-terminal domain-containing protein n=1 Tax=Mytilus galloprovincialis TaxID=29158 RepID=A0A8B6FC04_MYTGA|nr:Hypothetical predicted protein [Mytilus galloprovincialis]